MPAKQYEVVVEFAERDNEGNLKTFKVGSMYSGPRAQEYLEGRAKNGLFFDAHGAALIREKTTASDNASGSGDDSKEK